MEDNGRILIADDESSFARPLAELFRREGFAPTCAPDAGAARNLLEESDFDLLIADINMPGNVRLELLASLPARSKGLPVILMTGSPSVETAAKAVGLAVIAYVIKPPDFDELLGTARRAVTNYRALRAARSSRESLERWCRELMVLEEGLAKNPDAPGASTAADFVSLTIQNLMASLAEFRRMSQLLGAAERSPDAVNQVSVLHALEKAVAVLERTRRNFKSIELRDLRLELETVLRRVTDEPGHPPS